MTNNEYICHSGGCPGADMAWETEGEKYGVHTIAYSFPNHKQEGKNQMILSHAQLKEGYAAAKIADGSLHRNFDNIWSPYVRNLLARNWFQVKNSEAVFAIAASMTDRIVEGGTGWAVQMAIDNNKPVYVFDQKSGLWTTFIYAMKIFSPYGEPITLTKNFAGIGSRKLTEVGRNAIIEVYKNNFGKV